MSAVTLQPGMTAEQAAAVMGQLAAAPQFISADIMTVDQLLATYPASASYRGKYARVSDYAGYVDRVLRCDYFADLAYHQWVPVLAEYGRQMPLVGDMTLLPLKSPSSIVLTGTLPLGVTRNVTLSTVNGRPGEVKEIKAGLTQLLGALNILGTGLGSGVSLALGGYQRYVLDSSGGTLTWVRLL